MVGASQHGNVHRVQHGRAADPFGDDTEDWDDTDAEDDEDDDADDDEDDDTEDDEDDDWD